jgi:glycosyltransferase involved in cell wall biosynthesis
MLITHLGLGGAEKVFSDHAKNFAVHHNIVECYFSLHHKEDSFITGNRTVCLDKTSITNPIKRWLYRKQRLEQIIRDHHIDICVSHMEGPNLLNAWAHAPNVRKVLCVHGSIMTDVDKSPLKTRLFNKFLLPFFYKKADVVVAVSQAMCTELRAIGLSIEKTIAIPNYFDLDQIRTLANEPLGIYEPLFSQNRILLNVGRLARQKNQKLLVDVIAELRKQGRSEKLVLVGEGPTKNDLILKANALGLRVCDCSYESTVDVNADVFILGKHLNPYRFMKHAALFVLSSVNEGFPLVLGEAMACGLPIVSVDCPTGPREMLSSKPEVLPRKFAGVEWVDCGALLPAVGLEGNDFDASAWTEAITGLLQSKRRTAAVQALTRVEAFGKIPLTHRWLQLLDGNSRHSH